MSKFRIVELQLTSGAVTYVLEQEDPASEFGWTSVWRNEDLELIREAKAKREGRGGAVTSRKVIE
jgi:hypothetical protein